MKEPEDGKSFFPIACDVEEGHIYNWCGCGQSSTPPFCDKEACPQRVEYKAPLTETVYFCQCMETKDPPFCDGSHAAILRRVIAARGKRI